MKEEFILEKEVVRVIFHLNGGYTQVVWQRSENTAWAGTGWMFDIPTHVIPFDLRIIGSCFILSIKKFGVENLEDIEYIRIASVDIFNIERFK
ncbi:hypothetical protein [Rivularia sp. UHCC 0363]|uniref:hypothetical protein n=1 Tax=Rivularia sp. UHCC 0363 TaxID=3110244 RepID=UPI002B212B76|nr:hypothetical protein [Rivularia sp. UHCC 0363]MEA5598479.1 hypothetical protein [Rivularia sp. UHCC 0363]